MKKVVACDTYVSYCADAHNLHYRGLIPLLGYPNSIQLVFDKKKGRELGSRIFDYYQLVAENSAGNKAARLSDWLRHIRDLDLITKNSVAIERRPSHKRPFFLAVVEETGETCKFLSAEHQHYSDIDSGIMDNAILSPEMAIEYIDENIQAKKTADISTERVIIMFHIGDKIEASDNAILVNKSSVTKSFNAMEEFSKEDTLDHVRALLDEVLRSNDKRTHDLFSGFLEQVAKGEDTNKIAASSIWQSFKKTLSEAGDTANSSTAIGKAIEYWDGFFAGLS